MRKRPWIIYLLVSGFTLFPLWMVLQAFVLRPERGFIDAASRIYERPAWAVVTLVAWFVAFGIWRMRLWGYWLYLGWLVGLVAYNTAVFVTEGPTRVPRTHVSMYLGLTALALVATAVFLRREIRAPYANPRLRWWESPPRYRTELVCEQGRILDISLGGVYVESAAEVPIGAQLALRFEAFGRPVEARGTIVWTWPGSPDRPRGFGLKFTALGATDRAALKQVLTQLRRLGRKDREPLAARAA